MTPLLIALNAAFASSNLEDGPAAEVITRTLPTDAPALTLSAGASNVTLRGVSGAASSRVVITPTRWEEGCEVQFGGDRTLALATFVQAGQPAGRECKADVVVELAGATAVTLELDRGRITLEDAPGALTVRLGAGSVSGSLAGPADVIIDYGRVDLWDLREEASVSGKAALVSLAYAAAPAGTVAAAVDVGHVRARFPYGAYLDSAVDPGVGRLLSAIPARADAPTRLEARTKVGSVRVQADLGEPPAVVASASTGDD